MPENAPDMTANPRDVVFLHGWCGHGDEVEAIDPPFPDGSWPSWTPSPGSFDLESWPLPADRKPGEAEQTMRAFADDVLEGVRRAIVDAGFAGATIVGHSLGGCMACVLASDPMLATPRVVLLDSGVPMPADRRDATVERMIAWIDRAATGGRLVAQAGWIADASSWVPDFFNLEDQGEARLQIERRFMFAPVVEARRWVADAMADHGGGRIAARRSPRTCRRPPECRSTCGPSVPRPTSRIWRNRALRPRVAPSERERGSPTDVPAAVALSTSGTGVGDLHGRADP